MIFVPSIMAAAITNVMWREVLRYASVVLDTHWSMIFVVKVYIALNAVH